MYHSLKGVIYLALFHNYCETIPSNSAITQLIPGRIWSNWTKGEWPKIQPTYFMWKSWIHKRSNYYSLTSNHLGDHQISPVQLYPSSRSESVHSSYRNPVGELPRQWLLKNAKKIMKKSSSIQRKDQIIFIQQVPQVLLKE